METTPGDYAILGLLSQEPLSGYDIRKRLAQSTGHFWNESYGQIYPALRRLTALGFTEPAEAKKQGRRTSQTFRLTAAGLDSLKAWLLAEPQAPPARNELLLKLFFGNNVPASPLLAHVEQFRRRQRQGLEVYRGIERMIHEDHAPDPASQYWLITLSYGMHCAQALLDWAAETVAILEKRKDE